MSLIEDIQINSLSEAHEVLKGIGVDDNLFEKAHKDGDLHPNGKWVWVSSAAGGKGDWRTLNGRTHKKHTAANAGSSATAGNSAGAKSSAGNSSGSGAGAGSMDSGVAGKKSSAGGTVTKKTIVTKQQVEKVLSDFNKKYGVTSYLDNGIPESLLNHVFVSNYPILSGKDAILYEIASSIKHGADAVANRLNASEVVMENNWKAVNSGSRRYILLKSKDRMGYFHCISIVKYKKK